MPATRSRSFQDDVVRTLAVVLLAILPFLPSLRNGFNFDDDGMLLQNTAFRGLAPANLHWMFTTFHMGHYQPLAWASLACDYLTWGLDPRGFHLTSLLLHGLNAVLVFRIALFMLPTSAGNEAITRWCAAFAGIVWAIHPLRVETVAWATERRAVLSATFLLAAALCYLHAHGGGGRRRARRWMTASLSCFVLALFTLAIAVVFPALLLLLDMYRLGRLRLPRRVWVEKLPFAVGAAAAAIWAPLAQRAGGATVTLEQFSLLSRLAQASYGLVFYLWKTLAPFHLAPIYDIEPPVSFARPAYLASGLCVIALALVMVRIARRHRAIAVAAAAYLLFLLPVLGFFQSGIQLVADRYSYLPGVGLAILVGGAGAEALVAGRARRDASTTRSFVTAALVVLATTTFMSWRQCTVWRSPETLWSHALERHPGATAHNNYAGVLAGEGREREAIAHLEEALRLNPVHVETYVNLANLYAREGGVERAVDLYRKALAMDPHDFRAHLELGNIEALLGDVADAERQYREAIVSRPESPETHYNLANLLVKTGRAGEAVEEFRRVLAVEPRSVRAHWKLAETLDRLGRRAETERELEGLLRLDPGHVEARRLLASLRASRGLKLATPRADSEEMPDAPAQE